MNNWAFKFIVPLALYAETKSLQMMTISYGLLFTPNIIAPPLINLIDGKLAKKTSLLVLNLIGFSLCIFGFFYFNHSFNYAIFFISVFFLSTVLILFQTLIHSIMKDIVSDKENIESMSRRIAFIDSLFPAIGPLIGAVLLSSFSYGNVFLIISVVYAISMSIIYLINIDESENEITASFYIRTTNGFKLIKESPFINFLLKRFFLSNIALHGFQSVLTFYLIDKLHLVDLQVGFFFAFSAVGLLIGVKLGRVIYFYDFNKWYVISITGVICAFCLIITPLTTNIYIASFAWCIVMLLSSINLMVFYTERQTNFQQSDTASVIAASYVIIYSAIPLGSVVSFFLSRYFNASESMLILGIYLLFIGFYFFYLSIKKQKSLTKDEASA
jgi:MFS family permease